MNTKRTLNDNGKVITTQNNQEINVNNQSMRLNNINTNDNSHINVNVNDQSIDEEKKYK